MKKPKKRHKAGLIVVLPHSMGAEREIFKYDPLLEKPDVSTRYADLRRSYDCDHQVSRGQLIEGTYQLILERAFAAACLAGVSTDGELISQDKEGYEKFCLAATEKTGEHPWRELIELVKARHPAKDQEGNDRSCSRIAPAVLSAVLPSLAQTGVGMEDTKDFIRFAVCDMPFIWDTHHRVTRSVVEEQFGDDFADNDDYIGFRAALLSIMVTGGSERGFMTMIDQWDETFDYQHRSSASLSYINGMEMGKIASLLEKKHRVIPAVQLIILNRRLNEEVRRYFSEKYEDNVDDALTILPALIFCKTRNVFSEGFRRETSLREVWKEMMLGNIKKAKSHFIEVAKIWPEVFGKTTCGRLGLDYDELVSIQEETRQLAEAEIDKARELTSRQRVLKNRTAKVLRAVEKMNVGGLEGIIGKYFIKNEGREGTRVPKVIDVFVNEQDPARSVVLHIGCNVHGNVVRLFSHMENFLDLNKLASDVLEFEKVEMATRELIAAAGDPESDTLPPVLMAERKNCLYFRRVGLRGLIFRARIDETRYVYRIAGSEINFSQ